MHLSEFINTQMEDILTIWEHDAKQTLPQQNISGEAVRDHLEQILQGIAARIAQPGDGREELSEFNVDRPDSQIYAGIHGQERYELGIETYQLAQEFRSLRMTVIELWSHSDNFETVNFDDLLRFNYELDRVLERSIENFTQEKQKQSRLYKAMLSSIPDPCYILSLEGKFQYANNAMAELCGLSVEQIEGRSFSQLPLPPSNIGRKELQKLAADKEPCRNEVEIEAANGEMHRFATLHMPILNEGGESEALSGIAHDITRCRHS